MQNSIKQEQNTVKALMSRINQLETRLYHIERKTSFLSPYPEPLTPQRITKQVAQYYGISPAEMLAHNRTEHSRMPRNIAIYLCKTLLECKRNEIARHFMRDPGTIRHAINVIERQQRLDKTLANQIRIIASRLKY